MMTNAFDQTPRPSSKISSGKIVSAAIGRIASMTGPSTVLMNFHSVTRIPKANPMVAAMPNPRTIVLSEAAMSGKISPVRASFTAESKLSVIGGNSGDWRALAPSSQTTSSARIPMDRFNAPPPVGSCRNGSCGYTNSALLLSPSDRADVPFGKRSRQNDPGPARPLATGGLPCRR